MSALQAIVLGLIQGITEFLPISSSAHLVLTSFVLGWEDQGLSFDIAAHLGTVVSVIWFFRRDLAWLAGRPTGGNVPLSPIAGTAAEGRRLAKILLLATIPVGIAGLSLQGFVAAGGRGPALIAVVSIVFALLLAWADRFPSRLGQASSALGLRDITWQSGLLVGLFQALAVFPGVSRSGVTLTAALLLGFGREPAARFSFLLAIPVGVLVAIKQGLDLYQLGPNGVDVWALALGFLVSALSSYLAIGWLLAWVRRQRLTAFVVYRVALGIIILLLLWWR